MLKLPYFPVKNYFLWLFSRFVILICFKTGEICFLYVKELLQWVLKVYPAPKVYTFLT